MANENVCSWNEELSHVWRTSSVCLSAHATCSGLLHNQQCAKCRKASKPRIDDVLLLSLHRSATEPMEIWLKWHRDWQEHCNPQTGADRRRQRQPLSVLALEQTGEVEVEHVATPAFFFSEDEQYDILKKRKTIKRKTPAAQWDFPEKEKNKLLVGFLQYIKLYMNS